MDSRFSRFAAVDAQLFVTGFTAGSLSRTGVTSTLPASWVRPLNSPATPVTCTRSPTATVDWVAPVYTNTAFEAREVSTCPPVPGVWITNPPRVPGSPGYTAVTTEGSVVTVWPFRGVSSPVPWI